MKVVLFCGGFGLRIRDYHGDIPKPMIPIGYRPVLWHVMRYYAHFGYNDFLLCLGYRADVVKEYFLNYKEAESNDFVLSDGGRSIELLSTDTADWRAAFLDTGIRSNIAQRLLAVRHRLMGEELFLANYADVVTDAPLRDLVEQFRRTDKVAAFLCVRPSTSFHFVETRGDGVVKGITDVRHSDVWINGGFFIMRPEIFDYIRPGEELVEEPFGRLIAEEKLLAYRYDGFWAPMDTLKDLQTLETLYQSGQAPWAVWSRDGEAKPNE
jgi:glucose-1-phosphate cytidylyltransferase